MESTLLDKIFRDRDGNLVLAQTPNLPLIVWGVASLLALVFTTGKVNAGLSFVAFGAFFTWAWLELFDGVNYFRRALGFCMLVGAIASKTYFAN